MDILICNLFRDLLVVSSLVKNKYIKKYNSSYFSKGEIPCGILIQINHTFKCSSSSTSTTTSSSSSHPARGRIVQGFLSS